MSHLPSWVAEEKLTPERIRELREKIYFHDEHSGGYVTVEELWLLLDVYEANRQPIPERPERNRLAMKIGDAIETALGHDYLDDVTAYGVALMVLDYLADGKVSTT